MTAIIKFMAISGVEENGPPCYLLQVDQYKFLLDCGWDEKMSMEIIDRIKVELADVDAVLLSHADPWHLGALPYLVGRCGLKCLIFATEPVRRIGEMFMYDWYQSYANQEEFDRFNLDHVDQAFEMVTTVKYLEPKTLSHKDQSIQITALPAGHTIGAAVWKILNSDEEEIIYVMDPNHKKERHLNGAAFNFINRPNLLILDSLNAFYSVPRRKDRDEQLYNCMLRTLRAGGNVLLVVDTAGRSLELALMLEQFWNNKESGLIAYQVALLTNTAPSTLSEVQSQIEWMSDTIKSQFGQRRTNPFNFANVKLVTSLAELNAQAGGKVVMASIPDMEAGFARDLFVEWASDSRNTIVLTQRTSKGTLGRFIMENLCEGVDGVRSDEPKTLQMLIKRRQPLDGDELAEYRSRREREELDKLKAADANSKETESDEDDEEETELGKSAAGGQVKHDYVVKQTLTGGQQPAGSSVNSQATAATTAPVSFRNRRRDHYMYPFEEKKIKWDDYGMLIRHEDFLSMQEAVQRSRRYLGLTDQPAESNVDQMDTTQPAPTATPTMPAQPLSAEAQIQAAVAEERPTKCLVEEVELAIRARLLFIDFEGRIDGDSLKKFLVQMKPKQLILVNGTSSSAGKLAGQLKTESAKNPSLAISNIKHPAVGSVVDCTTERNIVQVKLKDSLASSLHFQKIQDFNVAWLSAKLNLHPAKLSSLSDDDVNENNENNENGYEQTKAEKMAVKTEPLLVNGRDHSVPELSALPADQLAGHAALFIGDPRLSDLKLCLQNHGVQAEFSGGVLNCNGVVAVKKTGAGNFELEGCICDDYFRIRDLIYSQFAII